MIFLCLYLEGKYGYRGGYGCQVDSRWTLMSFFFNCVSFVRLDLFFSEHSALYDSELELVKRPICGRTKQSSHPYSGRVP